MWPLGAEKLPARPGAGLAGQEPKAPGLSPAWAGQTAEKHPTRKRTYFDHPDFVFDVLGLVGNLPSGMVFCLTLAPRCEFFTS